MVDIYLEHLQVLLSEWVKREDEKAERLALRRKEVRKSLARRGEVFSNSWPHKKVVR